ncbi:uncharacterized protein BT62DRAFT_771820 [Guyanagaster necrorhizus]|uniref:Uncharacterized protein n=1 Tax=Guyanagaster necrorhizus TaxID=856835 RepID=A0A9P8AL15_9AGAR|nr:uncharacterized protein BT62DRAFT_771820 [Guyanagaster necrorhizus MCA 3950]KAG7439249.1 hypothetical protein BT62DRAFT_771820 [Guyanagaster necrorhizus MCA 3950]
MDMSKKPKARQFQVDRLRHARYISRLGAAPLPSNGMVPQGPDKPSLPRPFLCCVIVIVAGGKGDKTLKRMKKAHNSQSEICNEGWGAEICDEKIGARSLSGKDSRLLNFWLANVPSGKQFSYPCPRSEGRRRSFPWKRSGYWVLCAMGYS